MLGIPPFTILFIPAMVITMFLHKAEVSRRFKRLGGKASETWIRSWF
jgi:hypothetical protein